jgi:hypothetical protein
MNWALIITIIKQQKTDYITHIFLENLGKVEDPQFTSLQAHKDPYYDAYCFDVHKIKFTNILQSFLFKVNF